MKTPKATNSDFAFLTKIYSGAGECRFHVSTSEVTAHRLGKDLDSSVEKIDIYFIDGRWYGPVFLNSPTKEDLIVEDEIENKKKKQKLIDKFKGREPMTEEDFELALKILGESS